MMKQVYDMLQHRGLKPGAVVISRAGHDRGRIYLVLRLEAPFVWLSDGCWRPYEKQKKKRIRHLHWVGEIQQADRLAAIDSLSDSGQKDAVIRRLIDEFVQAHPLKEGR